jgi:hypothetical protein
MPAAQYKSTNLIEPSNSLLLSQRRMDNLDPAFTIPPVLWGTIGSLVILSTIGGLIYAYFFNRKQNSFRVNLPDKIACSDCKYFNSNHFLKCALHPVTVLTEQAVDCIDYDQKVEIKQVKAWRRVLLAIQRVFPN